MNQIIADLKKVSSVGPWSTDSHALSVSIDELERLNKENSKLVEELADLTETTQKVEEILDDKT